MVLFRRTAIIVLDVALFLNPRCVFLLALAAAPVDILSCCIPSIAGAFRLAVARIVLVAW